MSDKAEYWLVTNKCGYFERFNNLPAAHDAFVKVHSTTWPHLFHFVDGEPTDVTPGQPKRVLKPVDTSALTKLADACHQSYAPKSPATVGLQLRVHKLEEQVAALLAEREESTELEDLEARLKGEIGEDIHCLSQRVDRLNEAANTRIDTVSKDFNRRLDEKVMAEIANLHRRLIDTDKRVNVLTDQMRGVLHDTGALIKRLDGPNGLDHRVKELELRDGPFSKSQAIQQLPEAAFKLVKELDEAVFKLVEELDEVRKRLDQQERRNRDSGMSKIGGGNLGALKPQVPTPLDSTKEATELAPPCCGAEAVYRGWGGSWEWGDEGISHAHLERAFEAACRYYEAKAPHIRLADLETAVKVGEISQDTADVLIAFHDKYLKGNRVIPQ